MNWLLVLGAGATIEEVKHSGNNPDAVDWQFPTMGNFANRLFSPHSTALVKAMASYLAAQNIEFDDKLLNPSPGLRFTGEDMQRSPIGVFLSLERSGDTQHNVERFFEYAWNKYGRDMQFWTSLVYDGVYFKLFNIFTQQFGMGPGRPMLIGQKIASRLSQGDAVINLNYDIAFDLALTQVRKPFLYAPEYTAEKIIVYKPHGSINLYVNLSHESFFFEKPDRIRGSVDIESPNWGIRFAICWHYPPSASEKCNATSNK